VLEGEKLRWVQRGATAFADQGLFAGAGFAVNILLARWFSPEQYGAFALAFSIYLFLTSFHNALLLEPMSIFGPSTYRNSLPDYLGRLVRLHFVITIFLSILLAIGAAVCKFFFHSSVLSSSLLGVSLGTPWMLFFWLWRRAAYLDTRPAVAARGAAANLFTTVTLMFLLHAFGWLTPFMAFVVQGMGGGIASVLLIRSVRPHFEPCWNDATMRTIWKRHWEYGRWVVITSFVFWAAGDAYYLLVGSSLGMSDVAAFKAVQNFVKPINQFIGAITLLLVPWVAARFADRDGSSFQDAIQRINLLFIGASVIYLVFLLSLGKWLTAFVYGGKYTQFAYLLPLMALPILFTAAAEGQSIAVRAMQAPSEVFLAYTAAAVPTILVGVIFIRHWGLIGAALGLAFSSVAYFLTISYRYRIRLKQLLPAVRQPVSAFASENVP
jgi:O-antigen/teichoic acid export membrane protein